MVPHPPQNDCVGERTSLYVTERYKVRGEPFAAPAFLPELRCVAEVPAVPRVDEGPFG